MIQHNYADLGDIRLHYAEAGSGSLLLFLHGFPEFWYMWRHQLAHFAAGHRVVAPDLRGYNLSAQPRDVASYRMTHLVDDVRRLADHLGAARFTLVGHDWGGVIAWRFAQTFPNRLDRLIIVNAPHPAIFRHELLTNPRQAWASKYIALFRSPFAESVLARDDYAILRKHMLAPLHRKAKLDDADVAKYVESWKLTDRLRGPLNYYRAVGRRAPIDDPALPRLPSVNTTVDTDTLQVWGLRDRALMRSNLRGLDRYASKLRIERIVHASHWVVHERPGRLNRAIESFLTERHAPGATTLS